MNICSKGDASIPTTVLFYYKTISAFVRTHFWCAKTPLVMLDEAIRNFYPNKRIDFYRLMLLMNPRIYKTALTKDKRGKMIWRFISTLATKANHKSRVSLNSRHFFIFHLFLDF